MVNQLNLEDAAVAIGGLIGLLSVDNGGDINFTDGWFSNPVAELQQTGTRLNYLAALLDAILVETANPPNVFTDAQWYPIPNPSTGGPTVFNIVASSASDLSGQLGLGLLYPSYVGNLTIQAFVYVPLFSYDPDGTQFIANTQPTQVGLYITTSDQFQVKPVNPVDPVVTFTAVNISAEIYLGAATPTFSLEFEGLLGAGSDPSTYTTLSSLLNASVEGWLGEVIIQGSYWLHLYVGESNSTIGDLLTAANFLTEDDGEYHLSLANMNEPGTTANEIALNFVFEE
jgi:hypothetical protein